MRKSPDQWRTIVDRFHHGGLSQAQFAADNGLNVYTFRPWIYRLRRLDSQTQTSPTLLPVVVTGPPSAGQLSLELSDRCVLRFHDLPPPQYLSELLAALSRLL